VLGQIHHVIRERASYGHRRVTTLVNHDFGVGCNKKRIRRVMRLHCLQLPTKNQRSGRPHLGRVIREESNERWCSDGLEIRCWNGDRVQIAFALDCHDREVLRYVCVVGTLRASDIGHLMRQAVASRFGEHPPTGAVQWLSDNGGIYTALDTVIEAERLGLEPITTPAYSPQSNGMSEAFVNTLKRDYVQEAMLWNAQKVLEQVSGWFEDYNQRAPHSALGMLSPRQYRAKMQERWQQQQSLRA
jgi:putative transposase